MNTNQFDVYCNQSVNCPHVQLGSSATNELSAYATGLCYGYMLSSDAHKNYSQHFCWDDKAVTAWYGHDNPECSGSYSAEPMFSTGATVSVVECTDPTILPSFKHLFQIKCHLFIVVCVP